MKNHIRLYKQILRIKCKPSIETLDKEIITICKSIRNIGKKIKIPERDLPATIIGALYNKHYKIDESRTLNEPIDPSLRSKLINVLGNIGTNNGINIIGRCAENQTANHLLLYKKAKNIKNIKFTKAYRPRTARVIKRCNNCLNIFGN